MSDESINIKNIEDVELVDKLQENDTVLLERGGYFRRLLGKDLWGNGIVVTPVGDTPKPEGANLCLVTNTEGKTEWQEQLAYKTVKNVEFYSNEELVVSYIEELDGIAGYMSATPFAYPIDTNIDYTIVWDGREYISKAVSTYVEGIGAMIYILGNSTLVENMIGDSGYQGDNPNPDAPIGIIYIPGSLEGMHLALISLKIYPDPPILTIKGEAIDVKKIEPEFLPNLSTPQIAITISADGTITTDTPFNTAWAMTDAELQAGITVKRVLSNNTYINEEHFAVCYLTKREVSGSGIGFRHIQFRTRSHKDFSDPAEKDTIRCYTWTQILQDGVVVGDGVALSNEEHNGNYIVGATRGMGENGILYAEMSVAYDVVDRKIHEGENVVVWLNDTTTDEDTIVMYFSGISSSLGGLIFRDLMNTRIILYLSSNEDQRAGLVILD